MVDIDEKYIYSKTILIKNPGAQQQVWIVNNPFHDQFGLRFAKKPAGPVLVELFTASGARVYQKQFASAYDIPVTLSGTGVGKGVYFLKTAVDGKIFTNKVVKQ